MYANTEKGLGLGGETSQQSQVSLSKAEVVGLRFLCVDTRITHLILNLKVKIFTGSFIVLKSGQRIL